MSRWRALGAILAMLAGAGLAALLGFIAQIILARVFEPSVLGAFAVAVTVSTAVAPIALAGMHWFENDVRVQADPAGWLPLLGWWFRWTLPLGATVAVALTLAFGYGWSVALSAAALVVALACIERALARLQTARRFQAVAWLQTSAYAARLAAVLLAVALMQVQGLWSGLIVGQLLLAVWLIHHYGLFSSSGGRSSMQPTRRAGARELIPLAGLSVLQLGTSQLDRLIVAATQPAAVTGFYAAAVGLIVLAELVPKTAAMRFLLPQLGALTARAGKAGARALIMKITVIALLFGGAATAVVSAAAPMLIRWAFGTGFEPATVLLVTLAWLLPARFLRIALDPWFLGTLKAGRAWSEAAFLLLAAATLLISLSSQGLLGMLVARVVIEWLFAIVMLAILLWRAPTSNRPPG